MYKINNASVSYYSSSIAVLIGAGQQEINDALDDAEMDISIDWGDNWAPASWETLTFIYDSPNTRHVGETTLIGYLDVRKFEQQESIKLEYRDAWDIVQDKIPLCIKVHVEAAEE